MTAAPGPPPAGRRGLGCIAFAFLAGGAIVAGLGAAALAFFVWSQVVARSFDRQWAAGDYGSALALLDDQPFERPFRATWIAHASRLSRVGGTVVQPCQAFGASRDGARLAFASGAVLRWADLDEGSGADARAASSVTGLLLSRSGRTVYFRTGAGEGERTWSWKPPGDPKPARTREFRERARGARPVKPGILPHSGFVLRREGADHVFRRPWGWGWGREFLASDLSRTRSALPAHISPCGTRLLVADDTASLSIATCWGARDRLESLEAGGAVVFGGIADRLFLVRPASATLVSLVPPGADPRRRRALEALWLAALGREDDAGTRLRSGAWTAPPAWHARLAELAKSRSAP